MAAMVSPEPAAVHSITVGPARRQPVAPFWIAVSVIAAVVGSLAAWQIRSLGQASGGQEFAFLATIVSAIIASGGQWLLLRRGRLDVYWWVPATVAADLIAAVVIAPSMLNLLISRSTVPSAGTAIFVGAIVLGAWGLVVGVAQALVLRRNTGQLAWIWIIATVLGGVLSGVFSTAFSSSLLTLPGVLAISVASALSSFLTSASQTPILARMLR